jgi:hypothetical protein
MRGKYFGLLVMLMFAFVVLLAPEGATATPCPDVGFGGFQTYYIDSSGTKTDGTFCVKAAPGIPIVSSSGYEFSYDLLSLFDESLSQANLLIPSEVFCEISKQGREPRSVKIREYEPSTGFSLTDPNTNVITWDSLKLDPSNQENINVYTTLAGAGPSVMELKTGTGLQYVQIDGPVCCATTQIPTEISLTPFAFGYSDGPSFDITYDSCTGEANDPDGFTLLVDGAFVCDGETGNNCRPWIQVKKLGPRSGAALFTQNIFTGNFVSFFGFGNKIYQSGDVGTPTVDGCISDSNEYESVIFDNRIKVIFNSCGEPIDPIYTCTFVGGVLECDTPATPTNVFIAPGKANNKPDTSQVFQVLAGPRDGALIYANPSYLCTRYGIGCYR